MYIYIYMYKDADSNDAETIEDRWGSEDTGSRIVDASRLADGSEVDDGSARDNLMDCDI